MKKNIKEAIVAAPRCFDDRIITQLSTMYET